MKNQPWCPETAPSWWGYITFPSNANCAEALHLCPWGLLACNVFVRFGDQDEADLIEEVGKCPFTSSFLEDSVKSRHLFP
jgi:hypothetical protein